MKTSHCLLKETPSEYANIVRYSKYSGKKEKYVWVYM